MTETVSTSQKPTSKPADSGVPRLDLDGVRPDSQPAGFYGQAVQVLACAGVPVAVVNCVGQVVWLSADAEAHVVDLPVPATAADVYDAIGTVQAALHLRGGH